MADSYFRSTEKKIEAPEDPLGNNCQTFGESPSRKEETKSATILEEKEKKRDHLTATYWG